uniref:Uncharacterized protein n=1 Tax=Rhizophora mucronata TaxID=61149 RepID=A0A2P2PD72_RHIMU
MRSELPFRMQQRLKRVLGNGYLSWQGIATVFVKSCK